jgi:hypothetical protein
MKHAGLVSTSFLAHTHSLSLSLSRSLSLFLAHTLRQPEKVRRVGDESTAGGFRAGGGER